MRSYDLSPLYRSSVGFDHLARLLDSANRVEDTAVTYPPYNIEKTGDESYRVTLAVAGFAQDELDIVVHESTLTVSGKGREDEQAPQILHRGIARRAFDRRFQLADHIKVVGASLDNGLLSVDLVREVPEAMKPRKVTITGATGPQIIDQRQAA